MNLDKTSLGAFSKPDSAQQEDRATFPASRCPWHYPQAGSHMVHFPSKCKPGVALRIPREGRCCTQAKS